MNVQNVIKPLKTSLNIPTKNIAKIVKNNNIFGYR